VDTKENANGDDPMDMPTQYADDEYDDGDDDHGFLIPHDRVDAEEFSLENDVQEDDEDHDHDDDDDDGFEPLGTQDSQLSQQSQQHPSSPIPLSLPLPRPNFSSSPFVQAADLSTLNASEQSTTSNPSSSLPKPPSSSSSISGYSHLLSQTQTPTQSQSMIPNTNNVNNETVITSNNLSFIQLPSTSVSSRHSSATQSRSPSPFSPSPSAPISDSETQPRSSHSSQKSILGGAGIDDDGIGEDDIENGGRSDIGRETLKEPARPRTLTPMSEENLEVGYHGTENIQTEGPQQVERILQSDGEEDDDVEDNLQDTLSKPPSVLYRHPPLNIAPPTTIASTVSSSPPPTVVVKKEPTYTHNRDLPVKVYSLLDDEDDEFDDVDVLLGLKPSTTPAKSQSSNKNAQQPLQQDSSSTPHSAAPSTKFSVCNEFSEHGASDDVADVTLSIQTQNRTSKHPQQQHEVLLSESNDISTPPSRSNNKPTTSTATIGAMNTTHDGSSYFDDIVLDDSWFSDHEVQPQPPSDGTNHIIQEENPTSIPTKTLVYAVHNNTDNHINNINVRAKPSSSSSISKTLDLVVPDTYEGMEGYHHHHHHHHNNNNNNNNNHNNNVPPSVTRSSPLNQSSVSSSQTKSVAHSQSSTFSKLTSGAQNGANMKKNEVNDNIDDDGNESSEFEDVDVLLGLNGLKSPSLPTATTVNTTTTTTTTNSTENQKTSSLSASPPQPQPSFPDTTTTKKPVAVNKTASSTPSSTGPKKTVRKHSIKYAPSNESQYKNEDDFHTSPSNAAHPSMDHDGIPDLTIKQEKDAFPVSKFSGLSAANNPNKDLLRQRSSPMWVEHEDNDGEMVILIDLEDDVVEPSFARSENKNNNNNNNNSNEGSENLGKDLSGRKDDKENDANEDGDAGMKRRGRLPRRSTRKTTSYAFAPDIGEDLDPVATVTPTSTNRKEKQSMDGSIPGLNAEQGVEVEKETKSSRKRKKDAEGGLATSSKGRRGSQKKRSAKSSSATNANTSNRISTDTPEIPNIPYFSDDDESEVPLQSSRKRRKTGISEDMNNSNSSNINDNNKPINPTTKPQISSALFSPCLSLASITSSSGASTPRRENVPPHTPSNQTIQPTESHNQAPASATSASIYATPLDVSSPATSAYATPLRTPSTRNAKFMAAAAMSLQIWNFGDNPEESDEDDQSRTPKKPPTTTTTTTVTGAANVSKSSGVAALSNASSPGFTPRKSSSSGGGVKSMSVTPMGKVMKTLESYGFSVSRENTPNGKQLLFGSPSWADNTPENEMELQTPTKKGTPKVVGRVTPNKKRKRGEVDFVEKDDDGDADLEQDLDACFASRRSTRPKLAKKLQQSKSTNGGSRSRKSKSANKNDHVDDGDDDARPDDKTPFRNFIERCNSSAEVVDVKETDIDWDWVKEGIFCLNGETSSALEILRVLRDLTKKYRPDFSGDVKKEVDVRDDGGSAGQTGVMESRAHPTDGGGIGRQDEDDEDEEDSDLDDKVQVRKKYLKMLERENERLREENKKLKSRR
jgi:hypothetical protein